MNDTLGIPSIKVYIDRFGSLRNAYRLIGYDLGRDFDWIDRKDEFNEILRDTAAKLIILLQKADSNAHFEPGIDVLAINNRFAISLRLARSWGAPDRKPVWTINRRKALPEGYIIAVRLGEANKSILDYLLLSTSEMVGPKIRFTKAGLCRFDGHFFATPAHLAKAVVHLITESAVRKSVIKSGRASRSMLQRPKQGRTKNCPKRKNGHGWH